ncbi:MAG: hypothetical protein HPY82_05845 [Gammaproteobacteria bacterium]|nr:hypothetical protein [Gammaproteobacteria bacterium]
MNVEQQREYMQLCHAMQTGVAMKQGMGGNESTPKHLRVGINTAMADHNALARLLISKGVITSDEYAEALIAGMREEVRLYERELTEKIGHFIRLG